MKKASAGDLNRAINAAFAYMRAGVLFVPMPVSGAGEQARRVGEAAARLEAMISEADKDQAEIDAAGVV